MITAKIGLGLEANGKPGVCITPNHAVNGILESANTMVIVQEFVND